jgi:hypothetical protein
MVEIVIVIIVLMMLPFAFLIIRAIKADLLPMQNAYAKVIRIRNDNRNFFCTFEFPDGSEKELRLVNFRSIDFQVNDTGKLTYKESKNDKNRYYNAVISFEKGGSANG